MNEAKGRAKGSELIHEGYYLDSLGLGIDPGAMYDYEAIPYTEVTALWRTGLKRPAKCQPILKYNSSF